MRRASFFASALALTALVGCGDASPTTDADGSALQSMLDGAPVELSLEHAKVAAVHTVMTGSWVGDDEQMELPLPVAGGAVRIASDADGRLVVDSLTIDLDDVVVGDGTFPPNGATITDASIALSRPAEAEGQWSATKGEGASELDLTLNWSMMLQNGPLQLSAQPIDGVPFEASVTQLPDGGLNLRLSIRDEGELWSLDPFVQMRELQIGIEAGL